MKLIGLHFLLTYQCTFECDHCFVWGSPWQTGVFQLNKLRHALEQARDLGTVKWTFFEGGEPFLYYAILKQGVQEAYEMGFRVGIVSNAYWATSIEDAKLWLQPIAGMLAELSVSSDLYHYDEKISLQARNAESAAAALDISMGLMSVASPEASEAEHTIGTLPAGESGVMYRGRAAKTLVDRAGRRPWEEFSTCPYEDLAEPGRLHLDPFGNLHICQGISIGNLFEEPLSEIVARYDPDAHPITGPLLHGGPAQLARSLDYQPQSGYADACHLCDEVRKAKRSSYVNILTPDQMYMVPGS